METHPQLTIVIVSFNTCELTVSCIESIHKHFKSACEIIVVDNASSDDTVSTIRKKKLKVKLIENKENVGFAKANNHALKLIKSEYVLLLNSDTLLIEDCITPCLEYLKGNTEVGILSCKLLNGDKSIQATGGFFPTPARVFTWMFGLDDLPILRDTLRQFHPKADFYRKDRDLDWVTGAFFLVRTEVLNEIGRLDEDYFMYVEEMDFCFRAMKKGWKVKYLSSPQVIHYGGKSSKSEFAIENELRNQILFYKKHKSTFEQTLVRVFIKSGALLRALLFAILGKTETYEIYFKIARSI